VRSRAAARALRITRSARRTRSGPG
jgi:hypothetical protein